VVAKILAGKPEIAKTNDFVNNLYKQGLETKKENLIKVALISDLHVDFDYAPGSNTLCGKPLCCREKEGPGTAGKWGDFQCDIPIWTLQSMFDHINTVNEPDFLFWSGDSISHDVE